MRGSQMKTEYPLLQSDNEICFIQKQLPEVLIHLFHWETRWSIPVSFKEVCRWWTHNLTHSCTSSYEWNQRPRMLFFRSTKMWKSHGKDLGCPEGTGVIMQKDDSVRQHSRGFWLYGAPEHISLFFACLDFQYWTNTLYIALTSRTIKKQLCGPVRFHYACYLSYRWQSRYVTTVLPAFARNVFYGGCSILTAPLIHAESTQKMRCTKRNLVNF